MSTRKPPRTARKSWQHAIEGSTADPVAEAFVESLSFDHRLLPFDVQGSIAHATMLASVGLISRADLAAIKKGLAAILADYRAGRLALPVELEDIHMVVESELIRRIGEPGRRLHTARSRNDQVALDLWLWLADARAALAAGLRDLQSALLAAARRHLDVVMPSYTHLQQAQPICGSAAFLAYLEGCQRHLARLDAQGAHPLPIGSGAVAGSTLGTDRRATYAALAPRLSPRALADGLSRNPIDATATRDHAADLVFTCAQVMVTLSRMAEDFIIWMTAEFGYLRLDDAYTTGSSMMPQKRNPDMLELIRGKSALVIGNVTQLLALQKGLPMAYNRDLQEDKRVLFAAYDQTVASVEMMTRMVRTARLDQAAINRHLDKGFMDATALSEYLVEVGVPFRTGHQIVGALVRECLKQAGPDGQPRRLADLPLDAFRAACRSAGVTPAIVRKITDRLYGYLGPANVVQKYRSYGSAGLASCRQQIAFWQKRLPR